MQPLQLFLDELRQPCYLGALRYIVLGAEKFSPGEEILLAYNPCTRIWCSDAAWLEAFGGKILSHIGSHRALPLTRVSPLCIMRVLGHVNL